MQLTTEDKFIDLSPTLQPYRSHSTKVLIALCGLPARGKSFLAEKIVSYFRWLGVSSGIFNAGKKRRATEGAVRSGRSDFFCSTNDEALSKRDQIAMTTLNDAISFLLDENGTVAVFDATNTTCERRSAIRRHVTSSSAPINLLFLESICNDESVLENNLLQKVRNSPDFAGLAEESALEDLRKRIAAYEKVYESLEDAENVSYIKVIDLAKKVVCNQIWGAIPLRCLQLLMSCHVGTRPVYLLRAGHCVGVDDMLRGRHSSAPPATSVSIPRGPYENQLDVDIPLDMTDPVAPSLPIRSASGCRGFTIPSVQTSNSSLSPAGQVFAARLGAYIQREMEIYATACGSSRTVSPVPFTSTLPRAVETAAKLPCAVHVVHQWSSLGMLDTGICHGMSVESVRENMPDEWEMWRSNPFTYRFPGGESLVDLNRRLSEVVLEIERVRDPAVVVSHLSTVQSMLAYFTGRDPKTIPLINVPQHGVVKLTPSIYGWTVEVVTEDMLPEV